MRGIITFTAVAFVAVLAAALFASTWRRPSGTDGPVPLIDGLMSRQTPDEVRRNPKLAVLHWRTIEDSRLSPGDPRPRFDILSIEAQGYVHRGMSGRLCLQFFNGRLASAGFTPSDPARFRLLLDPALRPRLGDESRRETVLDGARVWTARNPMNPGGLIVSWEDITLAEQEQRWIEKYS